MNMRTVVIVQARMGSSRLPGKVLQDLGGKTVLRRVLERCAVIKGVDCVCCAIPSGEENEPVAAEADCCGAIVKRGSETDVLDRYYQAALELRASFIMRVTSDCPLLDPDIATEVLELVTQDGADYACNNMPPSWPHGLDCEAFRYEWLERAAHEAVLSSEREHVTPFIRKHPAVHKLVLNGPGDDIARHRWTLDTEQDLVFLKVLFERMPEGRPSYTYRCPLAIVENDPKLQALNGGQDRHAGLGGSRMRDTRFQKCR
jgi:spore coat polysaccharide biosynthesis protein SpsF (cytidylyltransferase family)